MWPVLKSLNTCLCSLPLSYLQTTYIQADIVRIPAKPNRYRLTCSSQASSMRAHSHSTGASGPRRKRRASSASRLLPCDSRNRGVSGMKIMQTISSVGGMELQIASQRQSRNRPAGWVYRIRLSKVTRRLSVIARSLCLLYVCLYWYFSFSLYFSVIQGRNIHQTCTKTNLAPLLNSNASTSHLAAVMHSWATRPLTSLMGVVTSITENFPLHKQPHLQLFLF